MRFHRVLFAASIVFGAISAPSTRAQVSGSITGLVTDPSGASVASAEVTAKNLETGVVRHVSTDDSGRYLLLSLPVSEYEVHVSKPGFQDSVRGGVHLVIGQEAHVDVRLVLTGMEEQITVTDAPIVAPTSNDVSGLVGQRQIRELPLNGGSYDLLLTLNPGIVNFTSQTS